MKNNKKNRNNMFKNKKIGIKKIKIGINIFQIEISEPIIRMKVEKEK